SSRRRHTRFSRDWSSDVCSSDLMMIVIETYHQGAKNWTLSDFQSSYAFLPETTEACSAEQAFELTINEPPTLVITDPDPVCLPEIGRASCRERVELEVVDGRCNK